MSVLEKLYTVDELWEISHREPDKRFELVYGELREMSPAGGLHGVIANKFGRIIGDFVESRKLGHVTAAETGYRLKENADHKDLVRAPDVGFIRFERLQDIPEGYIPMAPDLAVEVVYPHDYAELIQERVNDFLNFGTQMVWVVYPGIRMVMVHTPDSTQKHTAADTLNGGDVLPGFTLNVADIFP